MNNQQQHPQPGQFRPGMGPPGQQQMGSPGYPQQQGQQPRPGMPTPVGSYQQGPGQAPTPYGQRPPPNMYVQGGPPTPGLQAPQQQQGFRVPSPGGPGTPHGQGFAQQQQYGLGQGPPPRSPMPQGQGQPQQQQSVSGQFRQPSYGSQQQVPQQQQQRIPSPMGPMSPPINGGGGGGGSIADQMGAMHINAGSPRPAPPSQQPSYQQDINGPAKGKRAQRAYHHQEDPNAGAPQPQFQQPQQGGAGYQQQQPHPYANAPPPGPQPQHYQGQQPQNPSGRPDYLQTSQPLATQPSTGIAQPPHNPGTKLPGLRNRIDPEQIPSVVAVQEQDQEIYDNEPYLTCGRSTVPLSSTQYTAIDQGSSTPRFMRFTTYNLPATDDIASLSHIPMGVIVQPFAKPQTHKGEDPIYTVDFSQSGPPRCSRCRGYINPFCQFVEAGQKFICNLCGNATEVPNEYFAHLDVNGRRLDLEQRPELLKGSIDFIVPKDYWVQDAPPPSSSSTLTIPRPPQPMHYVFALDVSADVVSRRGQPAQGQQPELRPHPMLRESARVLKEIIYGTAEEQAEYAQEEEEIRKQQEQNGGEQQPSFPRRQRGGLPMGAKVAIVTFDKVVQFYNLKAGLDKPQMLVVGDVDDMFVPLSEGFLVDAWESKTLIENLLDDLPELFSKNTVTEATVSGPLKASLIALKHIGGQVNIFSTRLPTVGPGALKHRDEAKLQGTDKEKTLFVPQDPFYRSAAEEAVEAGVGINLFLFPSQFIDVASLGVLAGLTGGDVFFHPRFDPVRDGTKLQSQIKRTLTRETASCVTMRIRCSEGLRVSEHFGNFYQRNVTDLEFGTMDADKAIAARIKHDSKLDEKRDAYFQTAVLYTSGTGERRVRLHNVALQVTEAMSNVFRFADMDATMTYCAKEAIAKTMSKPLRDVRDQLTELCTKVLLAYRKHCASTTSPGQLILPESFKLFPVLALAFIKTKALKGGPVVSDVRTHYMRLIKAMGATDTIDLLYPKMMAIHTLGEDAVQPDQNGNVVLPRLMRCSYARMEPHGAYLIQNGDIAILWLGSAVSPQILRDLYDAEALDELNTRMTRLPNLPTRLSEQLRTIMSVWESRRDGRKLPLYLARQNLDGIEIEFSNMLVEDANNDNLSYVDYLCFVHKNIQTELSGEKTSELDAQSMWRTW